MTTELPANSVPVDSRLRTNQSLQAYVRSILDREVSVKTWEEIEEALAPIRARSNVTTDEIIEAIRLNREEREAEL